MGRKVYIARNYRSKFDAAGKAKMDCETILASQGWRNMGFKQTWIANGILGTLVSALGVTWGLLRLPRNGLLCLQYPFNKFYRYSLWGAKRKGCQIITLVHDVDAMKKTHKDAAPEVTLLNASAVLVVHNDHMAQWLRTAGVSSPMVTLDAFDYLHTPVHRREKQLFDADNIRVVFAGNMGTKLSFLYAMDSLPLQNVSIELYGVGFEPKHLPDPANSKLHYHGAFPSNEVIDWIDGDFGLVWYGESLDSCDGATGQYLKYNNPHKFSLYVLCGMPIIIWRKAAMADFVLQQGIGICLDSLHELPAALAALTHDEWQAMQQRVMDVRAKMIAGDFLVSALTRAETLVNTQ